MSDILPQITLAAVQASSVHLDRTATVAKACALIAEAGAKGADLIAFPEGFIPAHPCWFTVRPATDKISLGLSRQLFQNAVVIPSADTDALAQACSDAGITAVVGVCEKRAGTTGTLFNTQLFIGPDGQLLGKHRKKHCNKKVSNHFFVVHYPFRRSFNGLHGLVFVCFARVCL